MKEKKKTAVTLRRKDVFEQLKDVYEKHSFALGFYTMRKGKIKDAKSRDARVNKILIDEETAGLDVVKDIIDRLGFKEDKDYMIAEVTTKGDEPFAFDEIWPLDHLQ